MEAVQAGAVPAVSAFKGADPAFASGSPFDGSAERFSVFVGAPRLRRFALARDHHVGDTEVGELLIYLGLALAAGARIRVAAIRDVTPAQPAADQTRTREHAGVRVLSWHGRCRSAPARHITAMRLYSGSNVLARQPGDHLGNFPQALTHAALVQAALALRAEGG